ncbi:MAG: hypothetical protein RL597_1473 [Pseudomonadota bacterium]|nr:sulfotransferase [Oxalobacteraceae bacterium]
MWVDPYSVEHRRPLGSYLRLRIRRSVRGLMDQWVTPIHTVLNAAFVIGCGHSGTTLLAAKLGRLPGCHLPGWETNIFLPDQGMYWSKAAFSALIKTAETTGQKTILEKTPKHVHCTRRILRLLPRARFLVVTRNPLDNCASLFQRFGSLDQAIERWNMDNGAALEVLHRPEALHVRYEDLVTRPEQIFAHAAEFIGLAWQSSALVAGDTAFSREFSDANMALRAQQVAQAIEPRAEVWRERLTSSQVEAVVFGTQEIASKLGYLLPRDGLNAL